MGTPSTHICKAKFSGTERNFLGSINDLYNFPSWISQRVFVLFSLVKGYCSRSQLSIKEI